MRLRDTAAFYGIVFAAALAGAAAVLSLGRDRSVVIVEPASQLRLPKSPLETSQPVDPSEAEQSAARLAYVPASALPLRLSPLVEEAQLTEGSETENPEFWSADIRPAAIPSAPRQRLVLPARTPTLSLPLIRRLSEISPAAEQRLAEKFATATEVWPPSEIGLVVIKDEKILELFARSLAGQWKLIHRYPVLAASGVAGPKLRQGDRQVPEGVYAISFLNPNSRYHVAMRVNYPNAFDRQMATADGRKDLGGDIMIHGKNVSVGCLAVGDGAAEELFVLAAKIGLPNVRLIIAPTDFRRNGVPAAAAGEPVWLPKLYTQVASAMSEFKSPRSSGLLSFFAN